MTGNEKMIDIDALSDALQEVKDYVDSNSGGTGGVVDTVVTQDSTNLITSGAVYTAIDDAINTVLNTGY